MLIELNYSCPIGGLEVGVLTFLLVLLLHIFSSGESRQLHMKSFICLLILEISL